MMKLSLLLACLAVALAEKRVPQHGLIHQIQKGVAGPNPYIFLTVPKGRSQALVQGFEVIEENDNKTDNKKPIDENDDEEEADNDEENMSEDTDENDDDDDDNDDVQMDDDNDVDNDEEEIKDSLEKNTEEYDDADDNEDDDDDDLDNVMNMNLKLRKSHPQFKEAKSTQMMVSREHAGAILVPDQIIEIEGQSVIDENTGKPALLLPRAILDSIPDGSVVALMERSAEDETDAEAEARANRVIVRRRRKGARRNIKRRRGGNNRRVVNRRIVKRPAVNRRGVNRRGVNRRVVKKRGGNKRGGNKRRRNNKRNNVRVVRRGNRRGVNKRRVNRRRVSPYA
ncbi:serine/threonine-protein kinase rio2 [Calliphora vicina]|uniref:serine/threonine-protein kinase rio2 n=1 Tax=Calliphora vicina TaxID=7373 RepID=UPI00325B1761